jgi:hypothetical protein
MWLRLLRFLIPLLVPVAIRWWRNRSAAEQQREQAAMGAAAA